MFSTILALALSAEPSTQMLILTTGRKIEVKSVKIDGRLAVVITAAGDVLSMRAEHIDQVKTDAANEQIAAKAEADAEATEAERVLAEIERQRILDANSRNRALGGKHKGGMSVASGSAAHDVTKDVLPDSFNPGAPDSKPTRGAGGDWRLRMKMAKADYAYWKTVRDDSQKKIDRHKDFSAQAAQMSGGERGDTARFKKEWDADVSGASVKRAAERMTQAQAEYNAASEEGRRSGANASEWSYGIE